MPASFKAAFAQSLRPPPLVWLELVLAVAPGDAGYEQFRVRLHAFLRDSGIAAVLAGERLALIGTPGPVHAEDKALVVHWLIQQPPVRMIVVRRPTRGSLECREDPRYG